jgi:hypothetical protein
VDGHKQEDVVKYRQEVFLPAMATHEAQQCNYNKNGVEEPDSRPPEEQHKRHVVVWYHDESTFFANDRRQIRWVWSGETVKLVPKGEGASLMVANFVSADYGWLQSPDGSESACVLFKAGKNRDGYFSSSDILDHTTRAMDILKRHFPDDEHVFVFDNAPSHMKQADTTISAQGMSLNPTNPLDRTKLRDLQKPDDWVWGVDINVLGADGRPTHGPDGKVLKKQVPMSNGWFNGVSQSFYFTPNDSSGCALVFKGMRKILEECGIDSSELDHECKGFKCANPDANCCICRTLWNQPDFRDFRLLLKQHCKKRGFEVVFLPKFHCELNFVKQCWGMAKRIYRINPHSSSEANLERNTLAALDSVDLKSMCK